VFGIEPYQFSLSFNTVPIGNVNHGIAQLPQGKATDVYNTGLQYHCMKPAWSPPLLVPSPSESLPFFHFEAEEARKRKGRGGQREPLFTSARSFFFSDFQEGERFLFLFSPIIAYSNIFGRSSGSIMDFRSNFLSKWYLLRAGKYHFWGFTKCYIFQEPREYSFQ
jgi:hypothetical protein